MKKWEYITITRIDKWAMDFELKNLGNQGWELVSIIPKPRGDILLSEEWTAFLKRPAKA